MRACVRRKVLALEWSGVSRVKVLAASHLPYQSCLRESSGAPRACCPPGQECSLFVEVECIPHIDEILSDCTLRPRESTQRYLIQLSKGRVTQKVPVRQSGELWIRLIEPSARHLDVSAAKRLRVTPSPAVSVDVVNLPEHGRAGVDFEIVVRALDQFGK